MTFTYGLQNDLDASFQRTHKPFKIMPPGGTSGEVRVLKPADPEKLKKLHRHRRAVEDKREAGGLVREKRRLHG